LRSPVTSPAWTSTRPCSTRPRPTPPSACPKACLNMRLPAWSRHP
jgi:hypothetical protein